MDVIIDGLTFMLIDMVLDFTMHDFLLDNQLSDFAKICIRKQSFAMLKEFDASKSKTSDDTAKDKTTWLEVLCMNV